MASNLVVSLIIHLENTKCLNNEYKGGVRDCENMLNCVLKYIIMLLISLKFGVCQSNDESQPF